MTACWAGGRGDACAYITSTVHPIGHWHQIAGRPPLPMQPREEYCVDRSRDSKAGMEDDLSMLLHLLLHLQLHLHLHLRDFDSYRVWKREGWKEEGRVVLARES
ncbi:hypothetical protein E2C01_090510 [Portunus trituberculatus]|uniref:Uncharacterized protein n=1 Tax=Portunus trituberculatus TaxID=210409 RepID=A0A5B7JLZ3_PORTR|nr:hypothetical protein [Portunus trituberculatus]